MERSRRATAFAGSLLPARFLADRAAELGIERIVVIHRIHEESYAYVADRVAGLQITRLRGGAASRAVQVIAQVLAAKLARRPVIFFHECCWPVFDVAVILLRPPGAFFPQITMAGFDPIAPSEWPMPSRWHHRLRRRLFAPFLKWFVVYRSAKLWGEEGYDYFLSCRGYPPSIEVHPVAERPVSVRVAVDGPPRVLFLTGSESVDNDYLIEVYQRVMRLAHDAGFQVFMKDHPLYRLGLDLPFATVLDAAMPIELVDDGFDVAVAVASTALFSVGRRKVSIVRLIESMATEIKDARVRYLKSVPGGDSIEFPATLDDVRRVFETSRRC